MKKQMIIAIALSLLFSTGCSTQNESANHQSSTITNTQTDVKETDYQPAEFEPDYYDINNPALLQYLQDTTVAGLEYELDEQEYIIDNIQAVYISQEYLDELEFNSQSNIYFGYTQEELIQQFSGSKYVFTLSDDGTTVVEEYTEYVDPYKQIIKNVAIGTGVILVCVTVSAATAGTTTGIVFAVAAKTGTTIALQSSLINGVATAVIKGIQTKDFKTAIDAGMVSASEGFKWGAITGALVGGITEASYLKNAASATHTWQESEQAASKIYGGREQVSFKNGVEVAANTAGSSRPDIIREVDGVLEAIEVKNYELADAASRNKLYDTLYKQVLQRLVNLPAGTKQRIVLDVTGRGYDEKLVIYVVQRITKYLSDIYPNIPVDVIGL